jgi:hypothetical protein
MSLTRTDKDMVCPMCGVQVEAASLLEANRDGGHVTLREYICRCHECTCGYDVIQYYWKGQWVVHKFRLAPPTERTFGDEWCLVHSLPAVPLVMTGPGGDFVQTVEADEARDERLERDCVEGIASCNKTIQTFLDVLRSIKARRHGKQNG